MSSYRRQTDETWEQMTECGRKNAPEREQGRGGRIQTRLAGMADLLSIETLGWRSWWDEKRPNMGGM